MIVEHCPVCGGIISETMLLCNPPIYKKECSKCHMEWRKQEQEKHVTFIPDKWSADNE